MADFDRESMLEMFIFEMSQLLESLEQNIIQGEAGYSMSEINEIFRIMHTIKGSAAMMKFDAISTVAHAIEDLFFYLREENPKNINYSKLTDLVLDGMDFIKNELNKLEDSRESDGDGTNCINMIKRFLKELKGENEAQPDSQPAANQEGETPAEAPSFNGKHRYKAKIHFEDGCEMENIRAYTLVHNLGSTISDVSHEPKDIIDEGAIAPIRQNGFELDFSSDLDYDEMKALLQKTVYLKDLSLDEIIADKKPAVEIPQHIDIPEHIDMPSEITKPIDIQKPSVLPVASEQTKEPETNEIIDTDTLKQPAQAGKKPTSGQHVISVNVAKLDQLLNLMGELVIAEAMVTQNPELDGLELESFHKETRQLRKIINDVQDTVMSMRMVPLSSTFFKMHRIVRDMCKKLNKDVALEIIGEDTEVDKNIIEHISDPLMHIIRNSIDHGIEMPEVRYERGKSERGTVILEAKNSGGDVLIIIKDDGAGLNREKILEKAKQNGLLRKPENEYTDKEIHQFIFLPGFSTNDQVTSFSGRGVGMDVVSNNLEIIGGSAFVDSTPGEGSVFTLKIPLTLAIIEGMTIKMGGAKYTIPIISIKQSFKCKDDDVFTDPSGNEMITVRGEVYNVVRLSDFFGVQSNISSIEEGIMIMLENGDQTICLLVDELIGEQQVVVKTMSKYINKIRGISGCTLLGNGDISLIIDVAGFFDK